MEVAAMDATSSIQITDFSVTTKDVYPSILWPIPEVGTRKTAIQWNSRPCGFEVHYAI
jgi:hypothetical protein